MGRVKSIPRRRPGVTFANTTTTHAAVAPAAAAMASTRQDDDDDAFLGRRRVDPNVSVDLLLAHELLSEQQHSSQSVRKNRLEELEQAARAEMAAKKKRTRKPPAKAETRSKRKKKTRVSFFQDDDDEEEEGDGKSNNPPVVEVSVEYDPEASDMVSNDLATTSRPPACRMTLHALPKTIDCRREEGGDCRHAMDVPLMPIPITCEWDPTTPIADVEKNKEEMDVRDPQDAAKAHEGIVRIPIITPLGASQVWQMQRNHPGVVSSLSLQDNTQQQQQQQQALQRAIAAGTVQLDLSVARPRSDDNDDMQQQPHWQGTVVGMRMTWTEAALQVCHASILPAARRPAKRYQAAADVHLLLAHVVSCHSALLQEKEEANDEMDATQLVVEAVSAPSLHTPVMTARQVYAWTDNMQLQAALAASSTKASSPSKLIIPGLVPQLRPYQEHAVRWMLARERGTMVNDEWQLAWVVLIMNHRSVGEQEADANPSTLRVVPLSLWQARQSATTESDESFILLYCPFVGWLAKSVQEARSMTLGITTTAAGEPDTACRGGILAESMGLGKTVEVLSCILAHPRPSAPAGSVVASSSTTEDQGVKRVLDFASTPSSSTMVAVGEVVDMADFADVEESEDEDDTDDATVSKPTTVLRAIVTPEKPRQVEEVEDQWMDQAVVGSCICGDLVGFNCKKKERPIVLCQSCDEPMHLSCAAFESEEVLKAETTALRLRRTFSEDVLDCRVCKADRCPCCCTGATPGRLLQSRATLIITPAAILNQWEREVERHTRVDENPLKVAVYDGIDRVCKSSTAKKRSTATSPTANHCPMKYIHPRHLADVDVVLMTFDSLMTDLGHSDDNRFVAAGGDESVSNLRRRKKYRVVPSPLVSIEWWRVCLDEAQRVETPTAKSARMALKLAAVHRWCVSGTPIGRGKLEDLYGLLLFLRLDPFAEKTWFTKCLHPGYWGVEGRIKALLRHVFWRSTKKLDLVREQMGVPEQVERRELLKFSSIEKHFYNQQLEHTLSAMGDVVERERSGKKGKASQVELLAAHLHRLRAACCHPQVGSSGIGKNRMAGRKHDADGAVVSVSSRVLSMNQILDRFIDEARQKCEEAQRLAVMHTNAMAAISRLKVEAKTRGVSSIKESDTVLLSKSCKLYLESLQLSEENAVPTLVIGDAMLSGSVGFQSPRKTARGGQCTLDWKRELTSKEEALVSAWGMLEFEGPARKITELRLRPVSVVPKEVTDENSADFEWRILHPKDCVFQVASNAVGGDFLDVFGFTLSNSSGEVEDAPWTIHGGFRTNKSKNWRLLVNSFHDTSSTWITKSNNSVGYYFGIDLEVYEDDIASDPLQRLHCLHNGTLTFSSLFEATNEVDEEEDNSDSFLSPDEIQQRIDSMAAEAAKIEALYMDAAKAIHSACNSRLSQTTEQRHEKERDLLAYSAKSPPDLVDCWDDGWWDDFMVMCHLYADETQQRAVRDRLLEDLEGVLQNAMGIAARRDIICFPEFGDLHGFRTSLAMRMRDIRSGIGKARSRTSRTALQASTQSIVDGSTNPRQQQQLHVLPKDVRFQCIEGGHAKCMQSICALGNSPSSKEVMENSMCKVCKADWGRTGPKCNHCKIGEVLEDLTPDRVTYQVLKAIYGIVKSPVGQSILKAAKSEDGSLENRASTFLEVVDAQSREIKAAWRLWRVHLDLLNDLDELNQCKLSMRLANEGDQDLMEDELNAIVYPMDVSARYYDHAAKQAMCLGDLRRAKDTLRYLKNLTQKEDEDDGEEESCCVLCLCEFADSDKAVLRCGHSFHYSPCLEKLASGTDGATMISCPLRCRVRTRRDQVMIATSKARDDGTLSKRPVRGSWGTKVTRLVADVMDMRDMGGKGIVFSQWEDMMDIVEQALKENGIVYSRATSLRKIGASTRRFREANCSLLLLNVKNGAEGLTLVEATHVFVIEPLLNHGLDTQAINRVHRIGQHKKTYVWRYLVEDTIEIKIDKRRIEACEEDDDGEDEIVKGALRDGRKKLRISAGGIDGGFETNELLDLLKEDS